jgi:hypothetical protein
MRNTTKLKILLQKYTVTLDRDEDEGFLLLLTDKDNGKMQEFQGKSYSLVLGKAYGYLLRALKETDPGAVSGFKSRV